MVLGMSLATYTRLHVFISLVAIASGLVLLISLILGRLPKIVNALFLLTTFLTSLGGFLFPFVHFTPGYIFGALTFILLAIAVPALHIFHLAGPWRTTYVITAMIALYFNVFVLVVQLFLKVPSLHALAPTGTEPAFAVAQAVVFLLFVFFTTLAVRNFRAQPEIPS